MSKILVAEDDKFLASAYQVKLTKAGHEVKIVSDGQETIDALTSFAPDLLILDLIMPKVDGFAVLEYMGQKPNLKSIPVIVASNLGQADDIVKATKLGAKEYVVKTDLSMKDLLQKVSKFVEKKA